MASTRVAAASTNPGRSAASKESGPTTSHRIPTRPATRRSASSSLHHAIRWPQPERDVLWLHRVPHHGQDVAAQGVEVRIISKLGGELFEGLRRVVLVAVEAPVYELLHAVAQRIEQSGDHQGGGNDH